MPNFLTIVTWILFASICNQAGAAQALRFNYQAKLTDSGGAPLEGMHLLFISVYEGGSENAASSGALLFTEQASVTADAGVVNHVVGTGTSQAPGPLTDAMFDGSEPLYLQVAVDTGGNVVLPRTRLEGVPFAFVAITASAASNGVPAGGIVMTTSPLAPPGFSATGKSIFSAWISRASLPTARYAPSAAVVGNVIYVTGGHATGVQEKNEAFFPETNTWVTTGAAVSPPRRAHASVGIGTQLYVAGGTISSNFSTNAVSRYDPVANTWEPRQVMTTARAAFGSALAGDLWYVIGGLDGANNPTALGEVYNPATNSWAPIEPMPGGPREGCSAAKVGGKIYVIGGASDGITLLGRNEIYDIASNTWTTGAPIPVPRYWPVCVAIDGKIHVLGGSIATPLDTHEVYDPQTNTWSSAAALPNPVAFTAGTAYNGQIFLFGGYNSTVLNLSLEVNPTQLFLHAM